jgi:uncharacterized membrane protein
MIRARTRRTTGDGYTSAEATAILVQLLIVALIVRRSYAMSKGVPHSTARLVILPMLILFL